MAKTLGDLDLLEYEVAQRISRLCILPRLSSTSSSIFLLKSRILWHAELACHLYELGFRRMTAIAEGENIQGSFRGLVNLSRARHARRPFELGQIGGILAGASWQRQARTIPRLWIQRALKEQFRQEALPLIPNSFQHRGCSGAPNLARNKKVALATTRHTYGAGEATRSSESG